MNIDYAKISHAIEFYRNCGYNYIDVPWLVSKESMKITSENKNIFETWDGCLVASGEQSFLEIRDKLEVDRKYMCVTPCFRDDPIDKYHQRNFLKVELIHAMPFHYNEYSMVREALRFFSRYVSPLPEIVKTDIGYDIYSNGIEIGSYGCRSIKGFCWIYGTGCAEPRLSQVVLKSS